MTLEEKYFTELDKRVIQYQDNVINESEYTEGVLDVFRTLRKEIEAEILKEWDKEVYYEVDETSIIYYNKYKRFIYKNELHTPNRLQSVLYRSRQQGLKLLPNE